MDLLTFLAILFVTLSAAPIAYRIARDVQDEIKPSRAYITIGADALVLAIPSILLYELGQFKLAILVPTLLLILRYVLTFDRLGGFVVGGSIAGLGLTPSAFVAVLAVLYLYLRGLLWKRWSDAQTLFIPFLSAVLVYLILTIT
jgi:hypothetical protein